MPAPAPAVMVPTWHETASFGSPEKKSFYLFSGYQHYQAALCRICWWTQVCASSSFKLQAGGGCPTLTSTSKSTEEVGKQSERHRDSWSQEDLRHPTVCGIFALTYFVVSLASAPQGQTLSGANSHAKGAEDKCLGPFLFKRLMQN